MSIASNAANLALKCAARLQGEAVTLKRAAGNETAISDVIVSLDNPSVGSAGDGPMPQTGVLRLTENHRTEALLCSIAIVRSTEFQIASVGKVFGGFFRVEIATREDQNSHSNMFDLGGRQIPWS